MENVELKPIEGASNYLAGSNGFIYDSKTKRRITGHEGVEGYKRVGVKWDDGTYRDEAVHRLIAKTFIPNPEGKEQVHHIDEVKYHNQVSNLKWVTPKEHAYENGMNTRKNEKLKIWYGKVVDGNLVERYKSQEELIEAGYNAFSVSSSISHHRAYFGAQWVKATDESGLEFSAKYGTSKQTRFPWVVAYSNGYLYNSRKGSFIKEQLRKNPDGSIKTVKVTLYDKTLFHGYKDNGRQFNVRALIADTFIEDFNMDTDIAINADGDIMNNSLSNLEVVKGGKEKGFNRKQWEYNKAHHRA